MGFLPSFLRDQRSKNTPIVKNFHFAIDSLDTTIKQACQKYFEDVINTNATKKTDRYRFNLTQKILKPYFSIPLSELKPSDIRSPSKKNYHVWITVRKIIYHTYGVVLPSKVSDTKKPPEEILREAGGRRIKVAEALGLFVVVPEQCRDAIEQARVLPVGDSYVFLANGEDKEIRALLSSIKNAFVKRFGRGKFSIKFNRQKKLIGIFHLSDLTPNAKGENTNGSAEIPRRHNYPATRRKPIR